MMIELKQLFVLNKVRKEGADMTGAELIEQIWEKKAEDLEVFYLGYADDEHRITGVDVCNVGGKTILSVE